MTLPLPLVSRVASQKDDGCLKAIRLYFTKSQDFHTAINWLSKHAELIQLDNRPATSSANARKDPTPSDQRPTMERPPQPSAFHLHERPRDRPHSRSDYPTSSQDRQPFSQPRDFVGQLPAARYPQRPASRPRSRGPTSTIGHGFPLQRRQVDLRRNLVALQEPNRSAMALRSMGEYEILDKGIGDWQRPRAARKPGRTMSAAPMGNKPQLRYNRIVDDAVFASPPSTLDSPSGRYSPYNARDYPRGASSNASSQEPLSLGDQYLPMINSEPVRRPSSRLSQSQTVAGMATQSTVATDGMYIDASDPSTGILDGAEQRRSVTSIAPLGSRISGASPDHRSYDWQSNPSSQMAHIHTAPFGLPSPLLQGPQVSPGSLFAVAATANGDPPDQLISFGSALSPGAHDHRQQQRNGRKRPQSPQTVQRSREKKRACTADKETQTQAAGLAVTASSMGQEPSTTAVFVRRGVPMADCANQTDSPTRLQVDVLQLSAALKLESRLLQETDNWESTDDYQQRLLRLGAQYMQGLLDLFRSYRESGSDLRDNDWYQNKTSPDRIV